MLAFRLLSWTILAVLLGLFISVPISLQAQLTLALIVLLLLAAIYMIGPRYLTRQLFIAFASAIVMKYLFWRLTSTLPPFDNLVDFTAAVTLFAAELYSIAVLYLTVFVAIDPLARKPVAIEPGAPVPMVDVLVPSYDESADLVAQTLAAAVAMDYPADRLTVWLLDDGGTDEKVHHKDAALREAARERKADLLEVCNRLGVAYRARSNNEMAKAGNLNFGLGHATGDLVVVLDADHAPRRDFLQKTVGHFAEDERLFLVQTPHAFLNDDPIERNLGVARQMPAEHQMFYKGLQPGLDSWNASYFCGSAAVLRREALDAVGGFAGLSVTEDCETALELHARGWTSRFVDEPLIWGLQPETFTSLVKQRSRWCSGMLQIFILKNPLIKRGLTLAQRLAYASSCVYWFFPLMRLTFVFAPLLYIFFGMEIFMASVGEFVAYTVPYLVAVVLLQSFLFGRQRWSWMSEVYEYIQAVHLWKSVLGTCGAPRRPQFNVTPKGFILDEEKLSTFAPPYFLIFGVLAVALAVSLGRIAGGETDSLLFIVTGWNVFNLLIAGMALGAVCDRRERRVAPRLAVERNATLTTAEVSVACVISDVSQRGLRCRVPADAAVLSEGARARLSVPLGGGGDAETDIVVRRRLAEDGALVLGASFEAADEHRFHAVAELMGNSTPVAADRMAEPSAIRVRNILVWSVEFLGLAARETVRGLAFAIVGRREARAPHVQVGAELAARLRGAIAARPVVSGATVSLMVAASLAALVDQAAARGTGAFPPAVPVAETPWAMTATATEPAPRQAFDRAPVVSDKPAAAQAQAEAQAGGTVLRRLPVAQESLFLQGEWTRREIPLDLSRQEIAKAKGLQVTARTSVTALAEATSVDVWVNGTLLGRVATRAEGPVTTSFDLPPTLLRPGYNAIAFTARHQHRASCAVDAGYALWTQIDAAETGLVLPADVADGADRLQQLLGLSDAPTRLSVLVPDDAGEAAASRAVNLAGLVVLAARMAAPQVEVVQRRQDARGVLIAVGPDAPATAMTGWRPVSGLPNLLARRDEGRTRALRLAAADAQAAERALWGLAAAISETPLNGAPEGLAALSRARPSPLAPGSSRTFRELGARDRTFAGRHFRETVFIDLPSDVVATGNAGVTLKLKGDYDRNLSRAAFLTIKVNGAEVRRMPLSATPETTLNGKPFVLPLDPFHAGRNRLTVEAELPRAEDAICAGDEVAVESGRFFLSGDSAIELPEFGRAGIAPDLAALYWDGFPYTREPGPTDLFVGPDGEGLSAAAALIAAVTAHSGRYERWTVRFHTPQALTHGILVAPRDDVPPVAAGMVAPAPVERAASGLVAGALAVETVGEGALPAARTRPDAARVRFAQESWAGAGRTPVLSALLDTTVPPTMTVAIVDVADIHRAVAPHADAIPFDPRGGRFAYAGGSDTAGPAASGPLIFAAHNAGLSDLRLVLGKWLSSYPAVYAAVLILLAGVLGLTLHISARSRHVRRDRG